MCVEARNSEGEDTLQGAAHEAEYGAEEGRVRKPIYKCHDHFRSVDMGTLAGSCRLIVGMYEEMRCTESLEVGQKNSSLVVEELA